MTQTKPKRTNLKKNAKKTISILFYVLIGVFLYLYLKGVDYEALSTTQISWWYIFVSAVFVLIVRFWGVYVWFALLKGLGAQNLNNIPQITYIYAKSWLGRYIPGTATWILGKIYFASQHGISKNKLAVSSLLEAILAIVVTLAIALLILVFDSRFDIVGTPVKLLMIAALVACLVVLTPPVFNRMVSLIYKIVKRKKFPKEHFANSKVIVKGALSYTVMSVITGVSVFLTIKAFDPSINLGELAFVIGVTNLGGALSMLAIFVPSGIGVREGLYTALFSLIMPLELALITAVVVRLVSVATDLIFFAGSWGALRLRQLRV